MGALVVKTNDKTLISSLSFLIPAPASQRRHAASVSVWVTPEPRKHSSSRWLENKRPPEAAAARQTTAVGKTKQVLGCYKRTVDIACISAPGKLKYTTIPLLECDPSLERLEDSLVDSKQGLKLMSENGVCFRRASYRY